MTKKIKNHVGLSIEKNSFKDQGDGVVIFENGLSITDNTLQRNGTTYHVDTLSLNEFKGQVTADHVDKLDHIIAKVEGVERKGDKVVVNKLRYAIKQNALAKIAYDLLTAGFSTDFSIETYGPQPGNDGIYYNHSLIGLSQVVVGNNKNANTRQFNALVKNSLEEAKEEGLDVSELEELIDAEVENNEKAEDEKNEIVENKSKKQTEVDNESEEDLEEDAEEAEESEEEKVEESEEEVEKPVDPDFEDEVDADELEEADEVEDSQDVEESEDEDDEDEEAKKKKDNKNKETNGMTFVTIKNSRDFPVSVTYKNAAGEEVEAELESGKSVDVSEDQKAAVEATITAAQAPQPDVEAEIEKAVNAVTAKFEQKFADLKAAFDASAEEPAFKKTGVAKTQNELGKLDYRARHAKQINAAYEYLRLGRIESAKVLNDINEVNLQALKEADKVENTITIEDFGNFVISPELITEIEGVRNDYSELINRTEWIETLSLQFAWTKRSGDINMQNVEFCDDGANGNLKPISEYSLDQQISDLEELAAVTPVCNAATRFLAVDLLGDVARGYRNDFDRKRAQLIVARLQQAVDANPGNSVVGPGTPEDISSLTVWSRTWAKVAETTVNGVYVFNMSTFAAIQQAAVEAGANGPLSSIFLTGEVPTIFGRPYIVVPNDLLPTIGSGETRVFQVDGANVTVDHAVFYFELSNFTGRTSGGLQYDLSADASYEVGGVVRSAYQRNEIVLRGSFFRGGAIKDDVKVSGMTADAAVIVS